MKKEKFMYNPPIVKPREMDLEGMICLSNGIQESTPVDASEYGFDEWESLDD